MMRVRFFLLFACLWSGSVTAAQADAATDLGACAKQLKDSFAIRHTVTWPANRIGYTCDSGGPGKCHAEWHWPFNKAQILQGTGLDPSKQQIVGAVTIDRDVSGDASASVTYDANGITYHGHVDKGHFGGGATALVRFQVTFLEDTSDRTAEVIGRACAAKVFGLGKP
jgi:hypothetical protein